MLTKFLTAGTALLLAAPAMARPVSSLVVDNQWGASVNVQIDGRFVGALGGYDESVFRVRSGFHTVDIVTDNGTVLERSNQWFSPHRSAFLVVDVPMTTVTVTNRGSTPLFVSGPRAGLWIAPGRSQSARLPAGELFLTASIAGPRGSMREIERQFVWAEPGRNTHTAFAFSPPPPRPAAHHGHRHGPSRVATTQASTGRPSHGRRSR